MFEFIGALFLTAALILGFVRLFAVGLDEARRREREGE